MTVKARDNIENTVPVSYPKESALTRPCSEGGKSQLRSIAGAISWVARQCKPELLYRVGTQQTVTYRAKELHLKEANELLEGAAATADTGLVLKGGAVD